MLDKKKSRLRRAAKARARIKSLGCIRMTVHRSLKHIQAQLLEPVTGNVIASASSLEAAISDALSSVSENKKTETAKAVGKLIATRAKEKGVLKVAFDRSGFKYHGRVKAFADAAREHGMQF